MKPFAHRLAICDECLKPTFATLGVSGNSIVMEKSCSQVPPCNGGRTSRFTISSDSEYFLNTWISGSTGPAAGMSALIIELTDDCNLRCPTCIAGSEPGAGNTRDLETIRRMISTAEHARRKPDILMISGGEPTIHPHIINVLELACDSSIDHVMLITNGKRIAEEEKFAEALSRLRSKLEIYLQFDSLDAVVLRDIRGDDLSAMRRQAVERLHVARLPVTLICVVKSGLNDLRSDEVIRFALEFPNIRGVTFQPIKAAGRTESLSGVDGTIDLARLRRNIIHGGSNLTAADLIPHPLNPENIAIGYFQRGDGGVRPVTAELFGHPLLHTSLGQCLYFLPKHNTLRYQYNDLFRVAIVSFMDKYTFSQDALWYAPVGFVTPREAIIPLDSYYIYSRSNESVGITINAIAA